MAGIKLETCKNNIENRSNKDFIVKKLILICFYNFPIYFRTKLTRFFLLIFEAVLYCHFLPLHCSLLTTVHCPLWGVMSMPPFYIPVKFGYRPHAVPRPHFWTSLAHTHWEKHRNNHNHKKGTTTRQRDIVWSQEREGERGNGRESGTAIVPGSMTGSFDGYLA